jgi:hypothetical protein
LEGFQRAVHGDEQQYEEIMQDDPQEATAVFLANLGRMSLEIYNRIECNRQVLAMMRDL